MSSAALETGRLRLDPWDEPHTELLVGLSLMPEVMRFIGTGVPWPRAKAEEVAAAQRQHWSEHGPGWRPATDKATGDLVGFIALNFAGDGTAGSRARVRARYETKHSMRSTRRVSWLASSRPTPLRSWSPRPPAWCATSQDWRAGCCLPLGGLRPAGSERLMASAEAARGQQRRMIA